MLVLSRKPGERVVVGNSVMVTVLEVRGDRVKLGIDAPRQVPVYRDEVHRRMRRQQAESNGTPLARHSPFLPEFA
jgi:carbon storage regulator